MRKTNVLYICVRIFPIDWRRVTATEQSARYIIFEHIGRNVRQFFESSNAGYFERFVWTSRVFFNVLCQAQIMF